MHKTPFSKVDVVNLPKQNWVQHAKCYMDCLKTSCENDVVLVSMNNMEQLQSKQTLCQELARYIVRMAAGKSRWMNTLCDQACDWSFQSQVFTSYSFQD